MAKSDFFPQKLGDQRNWLENYREQIAVHGPTLGMTAAEVAAEQAAVDAQIAAVDIAIAAENAASKAITDRNDAAIINVGRIRATSRRNKTSSAYTEGIGQSLGIEGSDSDFDAENYKPKGEAKVLPGEVRIKFVKAGADGVAIYCKVTAADAGTPAGNSSPGPALPPAQAELAQYKKIGTDYHSPYADTAPLRTPGRPETREYYLRGIVDDVEIGVYSNIIRVVVGD